MASKTTALIKMKAANVAAAARRRAKDAKLEHMLVRQGAGIATAITIGVMNRNDVAPVIGKDDDSEGFPWKPILGGVALVGAALTKGAISAGLEGVAISSNAIYTERAITQKTLIAGV